MGFNRFGRNAFGGGGGLTQAAADARYVNLTGDTMTGPLAITGGTVTSSTPLLNLTQTWNNGASGFTGILMDITTTAADFSQTQLIDIKRNGTNVFKVNHGGLVTDGAGGYIIDTNNLKIQIASNWFFTIAGDVNLYRDAAGVFAQRNSTNAQAFRVYKTYTDASNFEHGGFRWVSNDFEIATLSDGTGSDRNIILAPAGIQLVHARADGTLAFFGGVGSTQVGVISDPMGGVTEDTEARAAIGAIIDALQAFGLIGV